MRDYLKSCRLHRLYADLTRWGYLEKTSTKSTIGPGSHPLAYLLFYVITVSPACAKMFITTLHQLHAASRIELQPHWLQQAFAVLLKVQRQFLNR